MTSLTRAAVALVAALSLVVATGCGGSDTKSNNDYVKQVNQAQTDFLSEVQKVGTSTSSGDAMTKAKQTFTDLSTAIDKFITDLKGVEPPDKVKDLHNKLIAEMTQVRDEVKKAAGSLTSNDLKAIAQAQTTFAASVSSLQTQMTKTIDDINTQLQG